MSQVVLPESWVWARIGDLCLPVEDVDFRTRSSSSFQYIDISSVDREQKSITRGDRIDNKDAPSRARQIVSKNDVLVSTVRPGLNAVAIVPDNLDNEICSTGFCVLRTNSSILEVGYLFAWVRSSIFIQSLTRAERGIGYPAVSNSDVENTRIPLPPLSEQHRIASILREADEIRKLRREANDKTQEVVKALFYDMFGDPATNPKKWRVEKVENLLSKDRKGITTGPFGSLLKRNELVDEGIPVWGINNVFPNEFVETGASFITAEKYKQLLAYTVQSGDILISRAGTVGRVCVAYPPSISIIGTNLIRVALDVSQILPEYFTTLFTFFADRIGNLRASGEEGSYSFLNPSTLRSLQIPIPPPLLQGEFVSFLVEIRKQINIQTQSLQHLDTLYQSLLAQAFSGELTVSWREAHTTELAQEAQERDELLRGLHGMPQTIITIQPIQQKGIEERTELAQELTPLQHTLLALVDRSPERYFLVTGLHEEITARLDEQSQYVPELDEEGLYRDFDGLDCSLDTLRRDLHFLAALGLLKELTLPVEDEIGTMHYMTVYRSLLADDDSRQQDLILLEEAEKVEGVSV